MEDDIMEHHLGRKLASNERVRHRDGKGLNNRFANLELVIVGEGQPEGMCRNRNVKRLRVGITATTLQEAYWLPDTFECGGTL
jgi:hypothetical protein